MKLISRFAEKFSKDTKIQIIFVIMCVVISRIVILVSFNIWKKQCGFAGSFFEAFSQFDTIWYESIIEDGYWMEPYAGDKGDEANWAFFPLFPIIIRVMHVLFPVDYKILAFGVNSCFLFLALFVAVKYILLTRNDSIQSLVYVILMTYGMYNFYFSALYTEAIFMFLIVLFFYCMERRNYLLMGVIGALASATRNMGVMLVFAVAIHYISDYFLHNKFRLKTFIYDFLKNRKLVLGIVLIPLGLFGYMLYLYLLTGDSLAFVHIQRAWGRGEIGNPVKVLFNSLVNVDSFVFYLSLVTVWGIYCLWILLWEKRWAEAIMTFLIIFIPLSTSVDSMPRYLIGSFVPLLGFTDDMGKWKKYNVVAIILFSIIFGKICLYGWFEGKPFVM